jgi:nucleotide-binding universal stress UspA family protein
MHILVATDGTLDPQRAADAVARWHTEGDEVAVFTTMNVPTDFLDHLGDPGIKKAAHVALEAGQGIGDRAAEQLEVPPSSPAGTPTSPTAAPVVRALAAGAAKRTAPIVTALAERGISAASTWSTTDNKTAKTIITTIRRHDSELVVIGSTGQGRFEGLLGSTGTKLVRHAPASVLVIRG